MKFELKTIEVPTEYKTERYYLQLEIFDDEGNPLFYPDGRRPAIWRVPLEIFIESSDEQKAKDFLKAYKELMDMYEWSVNGKFWKLLKPKKK